MAGQITFFKKNRADLSFSHVTITASEGQDYVGFLRNRQISSGWATTGSSDAMNTTIEVDLVDPNEVDSIILVGHNFKSYKIENWNGSAWVPFTTPIDVTTEMKSTSYHSVTEGIITKVRLTIRGTQVADDDKFLSEFVITSKIGTLEGWPVIKEPTNSRDRKTVKMLSGKYSVRESVGAFTTKLQVKLWNISSDLDIVEELYASNDGFLLWLSGGREDQFAQVRQGYRLEDLPLMKCSNEYVPEFDKGLYKSGVNITIEMKEVVD